MLGFSMSKCNHCKQECHGDNLIWVDKGTIAYCHDCRRKLIEPFMRAYAADQLELSKRLSRYADSMLRDANYQFIDLESPHADR